MRKPFLDNLRYSIVLLVILYHVCYLFNRVGIITNVAIPGIPALDIVEYLLYPWFMVTLFLISGICARYSLQRQTNREFLKTKVRRQLIPSVALVLAFGWIVGWVTNQYSDLFAGAPTPGIVKYLIYCMMGIGVLWFLHELLLGEAVLVLIRIIDRKDLLPQLGGKVTAPVLCLMVFALWGSAQILNAPVIECYRNGIYIFAFLMGYFVFSHDRVQNLLAKWAPGLLVAGGILAAAYTAVYWGQNYTAPENLQSFLTNAYAWFATLAVLGAGKRWLDQETGFTRYMADRSFGFYVLHYPLMVLSAYVLDRCFSVPVWAMYLLLPIEMALLLPPMVKLIQRIRLLRALVLGKR